MLECRNITMSSLVAGYFLATGDREIRFDVISNLMNELFLSENVEVMETDDDIDKLCMVILFNDNSIILKYDFNETFKVDNKIVNITDYLYSLTDNWIRKYFIIDESIIKRTKTIA